jgi:hypothetical protein
VTFNEIYYYEVKFLVITIMDNVENYIPSINNNNLKKNGR